MHRFRERYDSHFIRQSGVSFVTRVVGLAIAFLANVLLSRLLGPSGYGSYAIAIGWASVLAIPARLGLDNVALRFVTIYRERRDVGALRGLLRTSVRAIAAVSAVAGGVAISAGLLAGRGEVDPWLAGGVGLLVFPLAAMGWLSAVIRSFQKIFASQAYEQLLRPILLILLLTSSWLLGAAMDPPIAVGVTLVAVVAPLILLSTNVHRQVKALGPALPDLNDQRLWMAVSWPLILLSLCQEASNQIDLILLGILGTAAEAAQFAAAMRLSSLAAFGLIAIATVTAPAIASAYNRGDRAEMARLARLNARISLLFAAVLVVPLLIFGKFALAAFGPSFPQAFPVLVILLMGATLNAFTGNVANFMLMTGHERAAAAIMAGALAVAATLDILLIPRLGAVGAAIGSASGLSAWNLAMWIYVRRKLGIDSSALAVRPRALAGE
jgi:O-antigen/teichoic acid export membrane protein